MKIPFVDLKAQYDNHKDEIDKAISSVIEETAFIRGKYVKDFEENFAELFHVKNCVSLGNGTDALYVSLKMLGVGPGDEVITAPNSWIATSEVITLCGAKPVFVDIEKDYYNLDPVLVEGALNENTKAVIPVHLYGQPAKMTEIMEIAENHNLFIIEDCAQAHLAEDHGKLIGTIGDIGAFSFYPSKNLGAYGDAGAIITDNDEVALKIRMFANHGSLIKHDHVMEGCNSRIDGIQAAILNAKIPYLQKWTEKRIETARQFNEKLADIEELILPKMRSHSKHVYHVYCIQAKNRDELQSHLNKSGIATAIHYPELLPFLKAYKYLGYSKEDFPVASKWKKQILSLPMYPELTGKQIDYIVETIKNFYKK